MAAGQGQATWGLVQPWLAGCIAAPAAADWEQGDSDSGAPTIRLHWPWLPSQGSDWVAGHWQRLIIGSETHDMPHADLSAGPARASAGAANWLYQSPSQDSDKGLKTQPPAFSLSRGAGGSRGASASCAAGGSRAGQPCPGCGHRRPAHLPGRDCHGPGKAPKICTPKRRKKLTGSGFRILMEFLTRLSREHGIDLPIFNEILEFKRTLEYGGIHTPQK